MPVAGATTAAPPVQPAVAAAKDARYLIDLRIIHSFEDVRLGAKSSFVRAQRAQ